MSIVSVNNLVASGGNLVFVPSGSGALPNSGQAAGIRAIQDFTVQRNLSGSDFATTGSEGVFFAWSGSHVDSTTGGSIGGGDPEDMYLAYYYTSSGVTTLDSSSLDPDNSEAFYNLFQTVFPTSSFADLIPDANKIQIRIHHDDDSAAIASASMLALNSHEHAGIFFTASMGVPILAGDGKFLIENVREGQVNGPITSSTFISASTAQSSSGFFGQVEVKTLGDPRSGSATLRLDPLDPGSFIMSGSQDSKLYLSGSGQIGINTTTPVQDVDIRGNEIALTRTREQKGIRINQFGDLESFNFDADSASTGSEVILKYQKGGATTISVVLAAEVATTVPLEIGGSSDAGAVETLINGTFGGDVSAWLATQKAEFVKFFNDSAQRQGFFEQSDPGNVIGAIRYVVVSGSDDTADDRSSGEAAAIKAIVTSVDDTSGGVTSRLSFNVAKQTGDPATQLFNLSPEFGVEVSASLVMQQGSNIHLGQNTDGADKKIDFRHATARFAVGIDDSTDRFTINKNSVGNFETTGDNNDFQIDASGNVYINQGQLKVGSNIILPAQKIALNTGTSADYIQYADTGNGNGFVYKGNGKFDGSLTVTGAITSSIVTSSVIFSSGSNIFGDEASDTHKFVGSISASGLISSSGHIFGSMIRSDNYYDLTGIQPLFRYTPSSGNAFIAYSTELVQTTIGRGDAGRIVINGNVTASGNISSSATLIANEANIIGNITASGNISASGDIISDGQISAETILVSATTGIIGFSNYGLLTDQFIQGFGNQITVDGDNYVELVADNEVKINAPKLGIGTIYSTDNSDQVPEALTVTGNISASGNIYSATEEHIQFSFLTDSTTANWHGPNRQGVSYYYWNKDYGTDSGVTTIDWSSAANDERLLTSGYRVPYKIEVTKIFVVGHNAQLATSPESLSFTASLLVGSPEQNAPGASAITLSNKGNTISNIGESRYAAMTASLAYTNFIVSESQYLYPRLKCTNDNQDVNGIWTIYYRRIS